MTNFTNMTDSQVKVGQIFQIVKITIYSYEKTEITVITGEFIVESQQAD